MEVSGAVVLITGASSGIGAAAAQAFDRAGAAVVLAARRNDRLEAIAAGMRSALVVPTDLGERGAARAMVEAAIARFGRLDVLINDAAAITAARSDGIGAADLRAALRTNFLGPVEAAQAAVPQMRKQGRGHIINIGSPGAFLAMPLLAAYAASKGALSGWTRTMQAEWAGSGIHVTEYLPGRVDTGSRVQSAFGEIGAEVFDDPRQSALVRLLLRPQRPEEIAEQLVAVVRRPRPVVYSAPAARLVALLAVFPGLSRRLGAGLARVARERLGIGVFTPLPAAVPGAARAATSGAAKAPPRDVVAPSAPPPAAPRAKEPPPPAAPPIVKEEALQQRVGEAELPMASKTTVTESAPVSPVVPAGAAAAPRPTPAPATGRASGEEGAVKKVARKTAAKKKGAAAKKKGPAAGKKGAAAAKKKASPGAAGGVGRRRADEDEAARAPSPIMSERVRAAVEKAAASARGGPAAPAAKRRGPGGDSSGGAENGGS